MSRPHILIVGGAGVFGSRLARLWARRQGFRVSLGGRTEKHAVALQRELRLIDEQAEFGFVMIDRGEYWQCGYIVRKGTYADIKAAGIDAFRETVRAVSPLATERGS